MYERRSVAWRLLLLISAIAAVGCGDDDAPAMPDAGQVDAGGDPADAGPDAGPPWMPPADCEATGVDIYTPPPNVPEFTTADRGRVIACGAGEPMSAETIDARARERDYTGPTVTTGVTSTRVLYQMERRSGEAGYATGVLYLPEGGTSSAPLIVYVAGTTGLGDGCAPSAGMRFTDFERGFYALVGSGTPVFVPDLAGLGTPGTMAWLEPYDAGRSVLDGVRAALDIAPEGALSGEVLLAGHSAGGHAVLAAQTFQRDYAPELNILGVSAIAAAYIDPSLFAYLLTSPSYEVTDPDSGWNVVYAAMFFAGHSAAYDGEAHTWDPIAPGIREQVRAIYEARCLETVDGVDLRSELASVAPTVGALFDGAFRGAVGDCYWGTCNELGTTWQERWEAMRPALDPEGAPIWFHHGDADARIVIDNMVCPIRQAMANDARTQACIYAGADHNHIPAYAAPWVVQWATALAAGTEAPACPDATPLPERTCSF